jgi:pyocin large subunit-like protein
VAFTLGYPTAATLTEKFTKHGRDLGLATEQEYLDAADTFLGGPLDATATWECRRRNGDLIRYNEATGEFGVLGTNRVIKTYFIPDPAVHRKPNNLEYFRAECRK